LSIYNVHIITLELMSPVNLTFHIFNTTQVYSVEMEPFMAARKAPHMSLFTRSKLATHKTTDSILCASEIDKSLNSTQLDNLKASFL
jgi:hypothetical protein